MDGFALSLWVIRILFLALLYLFLAFVVRALWRDLKSAAEDRTGLRHSTGADSTAPRCL